MHKQRLSRTAGLVVTLTLVISAVGSASGRTATAESRDLDWVPAAHHGGCLGANLGVFPLFSDTTPIQWVKSAPNDVVGDYQGDGPLSAQVYYASDETTGKVTYGAQLLGGVLQPNATPVASLQGTVVDCDTMSLSGAGWTGTVTAGHLRATNGTQAIDLRHVDPVLPTLGKPAPEGAVTLFDGTDLSHWGAIDCNGTKDWTTIAGPAQWKIVDGAIELVPNTCSIISRETFGSATYHIEFRTIGTPTHSGVFPQAQYQTTVLQDYGVVTGGATGNYGNQPDSKNPSKGTAVDPAIRASRPPLEWQTLDITYTAPKFEPSGAPLTEATENVVLNGVKIFDKLVLDPPAGAASRVMATARTGVNLPLLLEYHGMPVQYRNIWVLPSKDGDDSPYRHVAPPEFRHPGVLVNQQQLNFVRDKVAKGEQPWTDAFNAAKASIWGSLTYTPAPLPAVKCGSNSKPDIGCKAEQDDASAAWTDALLWYISGDSAYARKAIQIMNAWSSTLTGGHSFSNAPVQAGWTGSTWAQAAELIRYTNAGWAPADIGAFENMLATQYVPNLLTGGPACFNGNWELTIAEALMNIAVFDNNKTWFDTAVAYWRDRTPTYMYLASDGPKPPMPKVPHVCTQYTADQFWVQNQYVPGLAQETARDFHHTFWGLGAATNVAETALQQGVNLYPENGKRIAAAYEWANAINNGATPPAGINIGPTGGNTFSMEVAYNEFHNRLGIPMPQTALQLAKVRPTGNDSHFLEWQTLTDAGVGWIGIPRH